MSQADGVRVPQRLISLFSAGDSWPIWRRTMGASTPGKRAIYSPTGAGDFRRTQTVQPLPGKVATPGRFARTTVGYRSGPDLILSLFFF